jgi:hypothetical protein
MKFLDFMKKKNDMKNNRIGKKERLKRCQEEHSALLEHAVGYLQKALSINNTMNFNQIKSIFTLILISKCYYYMDEQLEAANHLKEALLKFSDLNKYFFEKNIWEQIDPRVMFVTNGIIMEQILFWLARVNEKIGKRQLSSWIYNKLMEISYFRTNDIHRKACNKLRKLISEKEGNEFIESKFLLDKICNRLGKPPMNKKLCLVVSENLLKNFNSRYELREVLLKCIKNYINEWDLISYFQFDTAIQSFIKEEAKQYNLKKFQDCPTFCTYSGNVTSDVPKEKTDFYQAMDYAIEKLSGDDEFYFGRDGGVSDKYIFTFIYSEDFRFSSVEENQSLNRRLVENNISLYTFCLDDNISEKKMTNIKKYLRGVVEGYLILVKNFKIVKQAFQNISSKGFDKNILQSNYENHKFIL